MLYFGNEDRRSSRTATADGGNFMCHKMTAHMWFHRSSHELEKLITEIREVIDEKLKMIAQGKKLIDRFDWSHEMSDGGNSTKVQLARENELRLLIRKLPEDIVEVIYKYYICKCMAHGLNWRAPLSLVEFIEKGSMSSVVNTSLIS